MKPYRFLFPALALFSLAPDALADRFYFGSDKAEQRMAEGSADFVVGVLLKEENGIYVIRIEGGELHVAKSSVRKIESDGLTVEDISRSEGDAVNRLAEANAARNQMLTAQASARMEQVRSVRAMEASARRDAAATEASVTPAPTLNLYDPVLHVAESYGALGNTVRNELGGLIRRSIQKDLRDQIRRR